jgi:putative membrane-bound dehydrogenase-like protein
VKFAIKKTLANVFGFALVLSIFGAPIVHAEDAEKQSDAKKPDLRLIFLGDKGHHQPKARADQLIPVMRERNILVEYTEDNDILASDKLKEYDGLILYANTTKITPEQETGLLAFVEGGKGFIPLHCASYCFLNSDKFIELVGAQFQRHTTGTFSTRLTPHDEPIFKGFGGFESWDETYVHTKHNDKDRVVLEYRDGEPQAKGNTEGEPWTWIRRQGKGRVFYTAWGHDQRTWSNPGFQNLVERGIRWACGTDVSLVPDFVKPESNAKAVPDAQQSSQAPTNKPAATSARAPFVPPKMVDGGGKLDALEYDDVGPKVPIYKGGHKGAADEHFQMQRPLAPDVSKTYYSTPENFKLELFAAEPELAAKPICMNWDTRGRLWVLETVDYPNELHPTQGRDRIRICEDTDGDGKADKFTVFAEDLSIPTALTFYRGGVIVQNGTETLFLKDTDGDDKADVRKTLITGWSMRDTHGEVSHFQYGLDNWIWAMQGYNSSTPSFVDSEGKTHESSTFRMGFWRFKLDQNDPPNVVDLEFLRSTNNNTFGLGITEEGLVFGSTANGNPSVFMSIPNRYYERVKGWAADTLRMIADSPRFAPVTEKVRQVDNFGAYTAGAGHAIYTGRAYPQQWWNRTAFVCEPTGHLVGTFVLERDGAGFRDSSPMNLVASRDEWSSPIMAEVGPDGNMWIIDWYNYIVQHNPTPPGFQTGKGAAYESDLRDKKHGRIYRLTYNGQDGKATPAPKLDNAAPAELIATLKHPTTLWRLQAQRLLVERGKLDEAAALIAMINDKSVDEIGLNVGAIHAIGTLRGLGAFDKNVQPAALDALYAALSHPSAGVRRNAIQALPLNETSRNKLMESNALQDSDAQVKLAAILALSDLPPASATVDAVVVALTDGSPPDQWTSDALASAAAMQGVAFLNALAKKFPRETDREFPKATADVAAIVSQHLARTGLDENQLAGMLESLSKTDRRFSRVVLAAFAKYWPEEHVVKVPSSTDKAIEQLMADLPFEAKADLFRLGRLWGLGSTDELRKSYCDTLKTSVANASLSDNERLGSAQAWVKADPDAGAAKELLGAITPQMSQQLQTGLLRAAADAKMPSFAEELLSVYGGLLPEGRKAVVDVLMEKTDSTKLLLAAIASKKFDVSALSLEQLAALRGHPVEEIRTNALKIIDEQGANPNPDRQKVLAEMISVADAAGDAAHGKQLFTKNCAVCHSHSGVGETIAPDLTGMFVHSKQENLGSILDPSKDVENNYRVYSVIGNGKVYTGLLVSETRTTVNMVDSAGNRQTIQRSDIDTVNPSPKSLMPDGFEKQLSKSDFSDILEFLATPQRFVPLRLSSVATASSDAPLFGGRGGPQGALADGKGRNGSGNRRGPGGFGGPLLALDDWKPKTVEGVPFSLVDPRQGVVKNIILFGGQGPFSNGLPTAVRMPCGLPLKTLHLLSGVTIGGDSEDKNTVMTVRLHYNDGQAEDHELKNGVHFASLRRRVDVPESTFAFAMENQQMRYLKIEPKRNDGVVVNIEFIKAENGPSPLILAATGEVR